MTYTDKDHEFDAEHAHGYVKGNKPEFEQLFDDTFKPDFIEDQRIKTQEAIDNLESQAIALELNGWIKEARDNRRKIARLKKYL